MSSPAEPPGAIVFGCSGPRLTAEERALFRDVRPLGFILFARNCETPDQVRSLIGELRETADDAWVPILVDQEGGRVQRLRPPHWRAAPPAAAFGRLWSRDPEAARRACWLNARLIAAELHELGFNLDCLPCLDLGWPEGHGVIGDRAFAAEPETVIALGQAAADGLLAGGILPAIKHMPGHGRALADSHLELPAVPTPREELQRTDFAPFKALAGLPCGLTAHILFRDIDTDRPATMSRTVIDEVIRGSIGFQGLLFTDDIGMSALAGGAAERVLGALEAGCDVALHCNGRLEEMHQVAGVVPRLGEAGQWRLAAARRSLREPQALDRVAALTELTRLLADDETR